MDRTLPNYLPTGKWTQPHGVPPAWWPVPGRVLASVMLAERRAAAAADGYPARRFALVQLRDGKPIPGSSALPLDDGRAAYTVGKTACAIPVEHLSCSNTHAVFCFKLPMPDHGTQRRDDAAEDESADPNWTSGTVDRAAALPELYLIDVGSSNGTKLNGNTVVPWLYYPLLAGDTIRFGMSSREFVVVER